MRFTNNIQGLGPSQHERDMASLQAEADAYNKKKGWLQALNTVSRNMKQPSFGEIYYGFKGREAPQVDPSIMGDSPLKKRLDLFKAYQAQKGMRDAQESGDPGSQKSKDFLDSISTAYPKLAESLKGKSKDQIQEVLPSLAKYIDRQADIERRRAERDEQRAYNERMKSKDLADKRAYEQKLYDDRRLDRVETARMLAKQKRKDDALEAKMNPSTAQAKQMGLINIGAEAEKQFRKAAAKEGYDPSSYGDWIDNSEWAPKWMKNDAAIESQAAQSAWVEAFLRDASGAAIPEDERLAYAKDFFPRMGDSPQTITNKERLRKEKMRTAMTAVGQAQTPELVSKMNQALAYQPGGGAGETALAEESMAGKIVTVKGRRYRVGTDGDSLEPIE